MEGDACVAPTKFCHLRSVEAGFKPPYQRSPLFFVGARHCLALLPHAMLWIEGDACVAPTKLCHLRSVEAGFKPPYQRSPLFFVGARHASPSCRMRCYG